jgi:hypothetical protein
MKKKLTILLTVLLLLACVPAQSNAGALFDKVSNPVFGSSHHKNFVLSYIKKHPQTIFTNSFLKVSYPLDKIFLVC